MNNIGILDSTSITLYYMCVANPTPLRKTFDIDVIYEVITFLNELIVLER